MRFLAALLLVPALSWAHGEDKPGPHGGHIKMPGAFHVELNMDKDQSLHIFLLDMEFKNPTVKDSKIAATARHKKSLIKFNCSVMGSNHFHCIPEKKYPAKGEIVIQATRDNAVGNEVKYPLPLKSFPKEISEDTSHEGHH
ncbi:hypothetical protein [Bdellovibrio sp. HCB337]|uniref:hypothetical protein n=1 Tax=Bdellovibrio sp. HCB337 TaxID=3394358 RepID=UPI0039A5114B